MLKLRIANYFIRFFKEKVAYFVILFIIILYSVNNFIWLANNKYPGGPDEPFHLLASRFYYDVFRYNIFDILHNFVSPTTNFYPPLYYIFSVFLSFAFENSYISLVLTNIFYLFILLLSVYFIGLKLFNKNTAILSMFFVSLYPALFRQSRFFGPDFALAAIVCLGVALLLSTNYFTNRRFALLFGIASGLGMLIKWSYALFLFGPVSYILIKSLYVIHADAPKKKRIGNFVLSIALSLIISSFWYIPALPSIIRRAKIFNASIHFAAPKVISGLSHTSFLGRLIDYVPILINGGLSFLFFAVFLLCIVFYFRKSKNKIILISWFLIPYFVLSFSLAKEPRFMLPALAAIALISSASIEDIVSKKLKYFICCVIITLGLVQFFDVSYNYNRLGKTYPFQSPIGKIHLFYCPMEEHHVLSYGPPIRQIQGLDEITDSLVNYMSSRIPELGGVICEDEHAREIFGYPCIMDYYFMKNNLKYAKVVNLFNNHETLRFINKLDDFRFMIIVSRDYSWPKFDNVKNEINKKLLLFKNNLQLKPVLNIVNDYIVDDQYIENANLRMNSFLTDSDHKFNLIAKIKLPGNYFAYIYNKSSPDFLINKGKLNLSFLYGRAYLMYKNKELTPNGMELLLRYKNKTFSSSGAVWEVKKTADNMLVARGEWQELPGLILLWKLSVLDDERFLSEIGLETKESFKMPKESLLVNLSTPDGCNLYRTLNNNEFIKEEEFKHPHSILELKQDYNYPGLLISLNETKMQSFLSFEKQKDAPGNYIISHSPLKDVDFSPGFHPVSALNINVLVDKNKALSEREKIIRKLMAVRGSLNVSFLYGRAYLMYKNKELTPNGMELLLRYKNKTFSSSGAVWEVKKTADNMLVARGEWQELPGLILLWKLSVLDDGEIKCEVSQVIPDKNIINEKELQMLTIILSANHKYRRWITLGRENKFLRNKEGGVILKNAATKFIGVYNDNNDRNYYPEIFYILKGMPSRHLAQIHYTGDARQLIYYIDLRESILNASKNELNVFNAILKIGNFNKEKLRELLSENKIAENKEREALKSQNYVEKGGLEVLLDNGLGRIYKNKQEITSGFGFYTSVFANGYWHDSQNVLWDIVREDNSNILAKGYWVDLPIAQIWRIKLLNGNTIEWRVGLEVYDKVKLENVQANIMFNKAKQQFVEFKLGSHSSMCNKQEISSANFLDSQDILGYSGVLDYSIEPGIYDNYFIGKISVN